MGQALENIRRVAPELAENIRIVRNRDDLDPRHYTRQEWENMQQGEGFYDERDGSTVIFTDNLPPGDGTMDAVGHAERVILHERVGHAGLDALLRGSPYHQKRWDTFVESLPNNDRIRGEMEQISQERGYEHLRENPRALADEWFARTVQSLTPEQLANLKPDTRLGAMWVTFKDMLSRMVLGKTTQAWTDAQVRDLVIKGREALRQPLKPQGDGSSSIGPGLRFSQTRNARQRIQQDLADAAIESIINHEQPTQPRSSNSTEPDSPSHRSGGNAQAARDITTSLLRGLPETGAGWDRHESRRAREGQERRYLSQKATPPQPKGPQGGAGSEHVVYFTPGDSRVTKVTKGGLYGQTLDQRGPDEGYRISLRPALPSEYLQRIGLANKVFGDNIQVIGYEQTPDGPAIVTTQRFLEGPHPAQELVDSFLRDNGFEPLPESLYDSRTLNKTKRPWYRKRDGVMVADAKAANFVYYKEKVLPVDLIVQIIPDDVLDTTRAARSK